MCETLWLQKSSFYILFYSFCFPFILSGLTKIPFNYCGYLLIFFVQILHILTKIYSHQDTLSKCPGGHPILHRVLKLNSKISAGKYNKNKFTEASWFSTGELSKDFVLKLQRFHKTCCYFGQNPKCKGSLSPSNFDWQLSNILFTCLYLCVSVLRVIAVF